MCLDATEDLNYSTTDRNIHWLRLHGRICYWEYFFLAVVLQSSKIWRVVFPLFQHGIRQGRSEYTWFLMRRSQHQNHSSCVEINHHTLAIKGLERINRSVGANLKKRKKSQISWDFGKLCTTSSFYLHQDLPLFLWCITSYDSCLYAYQIQNFELVL